MTAPRAELDLLLQFLRAGDTLVITRIDRLARSLKGLVHDLKAKGVTLKAVEQPVDSSTAAGKDSSTCWACSPSSRPTCAASGKRRGSRPPRRGRLHGQQA